GAALKFPRLRGIVFDAAPVCEVAAEFIADYDLQTRIRAHAGDMWRAPFPPADVHFYSMIYHDWTPEKCRFLTGKTSGVCGREATFSFMRCSITMRRRDRS